MNACILNVGGLGEGVEVGGGSPLLIPDASV